MEDLVSEDENNAKLHQRAENLKKRISVSELDLNKQHQYNRCSYQDILRIRDSVLDNKLEDEVAEIFQQIDINISTDDVETAIGWVNQTKMQSSVSSIGRIARQFLKKKFDLNKKLGNVKLGF